MFEQSRIDGIAAKAAYVASPPKELLELLPKALVELRFVVLCLQ
jgi:hypothetical protein